VSLSRAGLDPDALFFCRTSRLDDRPRELALVVLDEVLDEHPKGPKRVMSGSLLSSPTCQRDASFINEASLDIRIRET
jgi:hypothetical protein